MAASSTVAVGFQYGELVLATTTGSKSGVTRKLFKLKRGCKFKATVSHDDLVAVKSTHIAVNKDTFRRPTLDDYVVLMDRVPAPTYPKDAQTMATILDVGEGSKVLEAGSGSGGLTLYLSRNVGVSGQVFSFESSSRHMPAAVSNYRRWRANWELTHASTWPDNVLFTQASAAEAVDHMTSAVDAVALDLSDPGPLLVNLLPILKPCGLVSVYLPNISQYITLLEEIRSKDLPLELEKVLEVTHKHWTIKPAADKHPWLAAKEEFEDSKKYICRPSHDQHPHTGLLRRVPHSIS